MPTLSSDLEAVARIANLDFSALRRVLRSNLQRETKAFLWHVLNYQRLSQDYTFKVKTRYDGWFFGNTNDSIGAMVYYFGTWEPAISEYVARSLRPGDVFIDVGANQGWYTVLASSLIGAAGRIVAIEASSTIFQALQRNCAINRCSSATLVHAGAWSTKGEAPLYPGPNSNMGQTSFCPEQMKHKSAATEVVTVKPLDDLVPEELWRDVRLVKIDVEGGEWEVVQGMGRMLATLREGVEFILEVTPRVVWKRGHQAEEILEPFRRQGFNVYRVPNEYEVDFYLDFIAQGAKKPARYDEPIVERCDLILSRRDCAFL